MTVQQHHLLTCVQINSLYWYIVTDTIVYLLNISYFHINIYYKIILTIIFLKYLFRKLIFNNSRKLVSIIYSYTNILNYKWKKYIENTSQYSRYFTSICFMSLFTVYVFIMISVWVVWYLYIKFFVCVYPLISTNCPNCWYTVPVIPWYVETHAIDFIPSIHHIK